jgi:hypothetical protein
VSEGGAFRETYWNILQTLGWIQTRDENIVAHLSKNNTDFGSYQKEDRLPGQFVEIFADPPDERYAEDAAVFDAMHTEDDDKKASELTRQKVSSGKIGTVEQSREQLLEALSAKSIVAYGYKNDEGDLVPVPEIFWIDAEFDFVKKIARKEARPEFRSTTWHAIMFEREAVLNKWPGQKLSGPETPKLKSRAGRRPTYDWPKLHKAALEKLKDDAWPSPQHGEEDWETKEDLLSFMAKWCSDHWGKEPARSSLQKQLPLIKEIFSNYINNAAGN